jgi:outer membrane protein assembly factor BamB
MLAWLKTEFVESINVKEPVVKTDAFGNVFTITTETFQNPLLGYLLIKYDSLGNKLWERKYEGGIWEHLWQGFTIDKAGNAYVSINYGGGLPGFPDDAIITKYSPDGEVLWELNYGLNFTPKNTAAYMYADTTGLLYLFGYTYEPNYPDNLLFTACLQQSDGAELWRTEYPGQFFAQNMRLLEDRLEVFATQYLPEGRFNFIQQVDLQGQVIQSFSKPDMAFYPADFNHITSDGSIIYGNRGWGYNITKVDARGDTVWYYSLPRANAF